LKLIYHKLLSSFAFKFNLCRYTTATFGGVALTTAGRWDAVLWKVNGEGTTLWAVRGGGVGGDHLAGVTMDGANAVVAAGWFGYSTATFGGVAMTSAGLNDAVVWKMSAEGTTLWVVRGGGTGSEILTGVAVDSAGDVVAVGPCSSSPATFGGVVLTTAGDSDAVVWKMSAEGTTLWVVFGGGINYDTLNGVTADGANAVVAVGFFSSSPATFGGVALTTAGSDDAVLWKMNAEGTTLWAVRGGGTSNERLEGVAVDGANAVVAAGYFSSSPATFGGVALTTAGREDAVVWKLSAEGTTLWAVPGSGTVDERLFGVAVDGTGGAVAAGSFSSSPPTFGGVVLTNAGSSNAVLWKVRDVCCWIHIGSDQTIFCSTLPPFHHFVNYVPPHIRGIISLYPS